MFPDAVTFDVIEQIEHEMNNPAAGVKALLFDLGGVLIDVDFNKAFEVWSRYSGTPASLLRSRFSMDAFYQQHERGEIDAGEYFDSLRSSLGITLSHAEFETGWNAILGTEIHQTTALLVSLKQKIPLYVFSNSNAVHQRYWTAEYAAMLNHFERVFVSSDIGKRKPDPEAFLHASREIGMPPDRIMFFDDTRENVDSASRVGMHAVHVVSVDSIKTAVAGYF
ncbi:MAG: putative haloacid dehalogenase-like hydrolase [Herminiimonas sp.]|nr:putative haloacid dehalogenase-like hydrolase [Herminiimonas sp.]